MAAEGSPLGNDLEICPSSQQLREFYRAQVRNFELKFIKKLKDSNVSRVTLENPREKAVSIEVARLVFVKSLASRFNKEEIQQGTPPTFEIKTISRLSQVFGTDKLVKRFPSGDFTVIIPFYVVVEDVLFSLDDLQRVNPLGKGQLVFALEKEGPNMKCLVPYGGSNPDEDDILPNEYALNTIEVNGGKLEFPEFKGEGTLNVTRGYNFVYSLCDCVTQGERLAIRENVFNVIAVVRDTFNPSRDLIRLDRELDFTAQRCSYKVRRPVKIISRPVLLPSGMIKYDRKVSLKFHKEDSTLQQGEMQLKFWNAAFNKCGIMTHDVAIPEVDLELL